MLGYKNTSPAEVLQRYKVFAMYTMLTNTTMNTFETLQGAKVSAMYATLTSATTNVFEALLDPKFSAAQLMNSFAYTIEWVCLLDMLFIISIGALWLIVLGPGTFRDRVQVVIAALRRQANELGTYHLIIGYLFVCGMPFMARIYRSRGSMKNPYLDLLLSMCSMLWFGLMLALGRLLRAPKRPKNNLYAPSHHAFPAFAILSITGSPATNDLVMKVAPTVPDTEKRTLLIQNLGEDDTKCTVCLDEFIVGDRIVWLPSCRHVLHEECCKKWWNIRMSCTRCGVRYTWVLRPKGEMMRRLASS
ncbi:uncharacterized protein AB675_2780 [Cyphellophora attinorum]|uniref:RING-type domain-containing protein n=1 Tax=Cyphellophora attinorum TaxID=1664694 RepID=A0A0N1HAI6_9EURO|nr:uncharacterized protein AB675_2780 [Phialophora attinorum]KPI44984.1 hypothetical protein AB675_2780 [Phialophora attinorum]